MHWKFYYELLTLKRIYYLIAYSKLKLNHNVVNNRKFELVSVFRCNLHANLTCIILRFANIKMLDIREEK